MAQPWGEAPGLAALVRQIGIRIALLLLAACGSVVGSAPTTPPAFTHSRAEDWINSPPLTLAGLKGKVVVVEFWAFECDNCLKSRAWIDSVEHDDGPKGLVIVGVHTPELSEERSPDAVRKAVERLGIHYPVMTGRDVELYVAQQQGDDLDPYAALISSALIGDTTHFAREDEVEAAWAIVDPLLRGATAPIEYPPASWGPPQAERLLQGPCGWHNPGAKPQDWQRSCGR